MQKWDLKLSKFKGKYFVYLVNTCTNSIVKKKMLFSSQCTNYFFDQFGSYNTFFHRTLLVASSED